MLRLYNVPNNAIANNLRNLVNLRHPGLDNYPVPALSYDILKMSATINPPKGIFTQKIELTC